MNLRNLRLAVPLLLGLTVPFAAPASAAPACVVVGWSHDDTCSFEAPLGAFVFGGVASGGDGMAWIAVQVEFNGLVVDSCFGQGSPVATCEDVTQAFSTLTHTCRVFGTGGPKFHCADPLLPAR